MKTILIGCDSNGYFLKEEIKEYLTSLHYEVVDVGVTESDSDIEYPDIAVALAQRIAKGETDRGILICGTGLGMAIAANKVRGVRAAIAHDPYSAERQSKKQRCPGHYIWRADHFADSSSDFARPLACSRISGRTLDFKGE